MDGYNFRWVYIILQVQSHRILFVNDKHTLTQEAPPRPATAIRRPGEWLSFWRITSKQFWFGSSTYTEPPFFLSESKTRKMKASHPTWAVAFFKPNYIWSLHLEWLVGWFYIECMILYIFVRLLIYVCRQNSPWLTLSYCKFEHAYQTLSCETAINTDFSELFSLKRIHVKYKNAFFVAYRLLLSHMKGLDIWSSTFPDI